MARHMWNNEVLLGKNSLLLVEGMDDVRFFNAFLMYLKRTISKSQRWVERMSSVKH